MWMGFVESNDVSQPSSTCARFRGDPTCRYRIFGVGTKMVSSKNKFVKGYLCLQLFLSETKHKLKGFRSPWDNGCL